MVKLLLPSGADFAYYVRALASSGRGGRRGRSDGVGPTGGGLCGSGALNDAFCWRQGGRPRSTTGAGGGFARCASLLKVWAGRCPPPDPTIGMGVQVGVSGVSRLLTAALGPPPPAQPPDPRSLLCTPSPFPLCLSGPCHPPPPLCAPPHAPPPFLSNSVRDRSLPATRSSPPLIASAALTPPTTLSALAA